ncbi:hypothetical protein MTO96_020091 [Rhipicephalus appendiculatus]
MKKRSPLLIDVGARRLLVKIEPRRGRRVLDAPEAAGIYVENKDRESRRYRRLWSQRLRQSLLVLAVATVPASGFFIMAPERTYTVLLLALFVSSVQCNLLSGFFSDLCRLHSCGCYTEAVPKTIDCSYKHIPSLNRVAVPNHVLEINLAGNDLKSVLDTYFYTAPGVHVLDLSHNQIQFIAYTALQMFGELNRLTLSHNRLASLEEEVFSHLEFNGNALARLTSLNKLILQSTALKELRQTDFDSLTNLKWLDLSGNGIRRSSVQGSAPVEPAASSGSEQESHRDHQTLQLLQPDVSEKPLPEVHGGSDDHRGPRVQRHHESQEHRSQLLSTGCQTSTGGRSPTTDLTLRLTWTNFTLDRRGLKTLPATLLNWEYVTKVDFAENDWKCDCKLEWMPHVVKRDVIDAKLRCGSPKELEGRLIAKLSSADMPCAESVAVEHPGWQEINIAMRVALGLLITVTVVLTIVIATLLYFKIRAKPHVYLSLKQRFGYSTEE